MIPLKNGDGELWIGNWELGIEHNPQSTIPNPQSPKSKKEKNINFI